MSETKTPDLEAKKKAKAARDKRYRENKAKTAETSTQAKARKAKPAPATKVPPKAKVKTVRKPANKTPAAPRKNRRVDARTLGLEKPDTMALIRKLARRKWVTFKDLRASGEFEYMNDSGLQEALKRMFNAGEMDVQATTRPEGVNRGRPPFAYKMK